MSNKYTIGIDPASPDGGDACCVLARMHDDGTIEVLKVSHNSEDFENWPYVRPAVISVRAIEVEDTDANHQ